jgi:hypothetical protein
MDGGKGKMCSFENPLLENLLKVQGSIYAPVTTQNSLQGGSLVLFLHIFSARWVHKKCYESGTQEPKLIFLSS